jgi:hypothetical protein
MRFLLAVTPVLASLQAVLSAPSIYVPVPYTQAPSYYPGYPWSFPDPQSGRRVCTVAAPKDGSDSVPNIVAAFKQCGRNGKVIFGKTTCESMNALAFLLQSWSHHVFFRSQRQLWTIHTDQTSSRPYQIRHGNHGSVKR